MAAQHRPRHGRDVAATARVDGSGRYGGQREGGRRVGCVFRSFHPHGCGQETTNRAKHRPNYATPPQPARLARPRLRTESAVVRGRARPALRYRQGGHCIHFTFADITTFPRLPWHPVSCRTHGFRVGVPSCGTNLPDARWSPPSAFRHTSARHRSGHTRPVPHPRLCRYTPLRRPHSAAVWGWCPVVHTSVLHTE